MQAKMNLITAGGGVKRFHVMHTLRQQTVAEHSFGVAWLVYLLSEGMPSANLLMAALAHDIAECETGDIPAPAKRKLGIAEQFSGYEGEVMRNAGISAFPEMLSAKEQKTLKFADTAELLLYCASEIALGNSSMKIVYGRALDYLSELRPWTGAMVELIQYIHEKRMEAEQ